MLVYDCKKAIRNVSVAFFILVNLKFLASPFNTDVAHRNSSDNLMLNFN